VEWYGTLPILRYNWKRPIHFKVMGSIGPSGYVEIFCLDDDTNYYMEVPRSIRKLIVDDDINKTLFQLSGERIMGCTFPVLKGIPK
jgi:hypothetical protein